MADTLTDVLGGNWKPVETTGGEDSAPARRFEPGDSLEGVYLGSKLIAKTGNMRNDSTLHSVKVADGSKVDFWGQKDVNDKLAQVAPGTEVFVEKTDQQKKVTNGFLHLWIVGTK